MQTHTAASTAAFAREAQTTPQWYAVQTCSRHEKKIADQLQRRQIEFFLPLYQSVRHWKDRRITLDLPLFPGYLFVHLPLQDRLSVLEVPSVVRIVGFNGLPAPLPEDEIRSLRNTLEAKIPAEPHPYLKVGRRVRVRRGPLAGREGILLRKKDRLRLVISIDLIMRAMAVELDAADVEGLR